MSEPKVALVTGSSSGIGAATVQLLSRKGYKVAVVGTKQEKVDKVVQACLEVSPQKFQPLALILDFTNPDNGRLAVKETIDHFGRLDVLVNNAGIFSRSHYGDQHAYDSYRQMMSINLDSAVSASIAAADHLKKTNGNLIFVSSVASVKASERGFAYCATKAAMSMFAKCMAIDLAPNVRVNIVSPGPVATPIFDRVGLSTDLARATMGVTTLQNRVGESEEVANSIAWLVSDEASLVNGNELFIDGGYLLKPSNFSASQQIMQAKK